jgi:spiro-SPASM protein
MSTQTPEAPETALGQDQTLRERVPAQALAAYDAKLESLASEDARMWNSVAFPLEIALELAAVCNLDCIMCPVPTTSRPKTLMEPAVAQSVIDQLSVEHGFVLLPQGFGETMLHAKWAEIVGHAVAKGIRPIVMLTNGTLLTERNIDKLLELEIDFLVISIDGVTPETYASVRVGGNLEKVERNVRRLIEMRGARKSPRIALRIIRMNETKDQIDAFFERWQPLLREGDQINVNEYNDWSGRVEDHSVEGLHPAVGERRTPCRMLWRNLSIHADGKVSACCHDSEDELIVGDVRNESVREIWNGDKLAELRRIHNEGRFEQLPICANCKNWW